MNENAVNATVTLLTEERIREIVRDEMRAQVAGTYEDQDISRWTPEQAPHFAEGGIIPSTLTDLSLMDDLPPVRSVPASPEWVRYGSATDAQRIVTETGETAFGVAMAYGMDRRVCDGIREAVECHLLCAFGIVTIGDNPDAAVSTSEAEAA